MNKQAPLNLTFSVICFGLSWAIYEKVLSLLSIQGHPTASRWIGFISAVGLFAFIFQLAMWLAQIAVRTWLSDESKLTGTWFQVFRIHNYTKGTVASDAIRHGPVTIAFAGTFIEITAENNKRDGLSTSSSWFSNQVSIQGSQIWLLFSSTGAGRGLTQGNMHFQYQASKRPFGKPDRLRGQFSDSSPATHFGSIELFRDKTVYEQHLRDLEARFPPVRSGVSE